MLLDIAAERAYALLKVTPRDVMFQVPEMVL
jgi:hypothetical protein